MVDHHVVTENLVVGSISSGCTFTTKSRALAEIALVNIHGLDVPPLLIVFASLAHATFDHNAIL